MIMRKNKRPWNKSENTQCSDYIKKKSEVRILKIYKIDLFSVFVLSSY